MTPQLIERLRQLRLHGFADALHHQDGQREFDTMSFDERLGYLVAAEENQRNNARFRRLVKAARFKHDARPEAYIPGAGRGIDRSVLADLFQGSWIEKAENVIVTGPTGSGKTWVACAIGYSAARLGFSVQYHRVTYLVERLGIARIDGTMLALRKSLWKPALLILDDFAMATMEERAEQDLFEILEGRDGSASTLIAAQRAVSEWHDYIRNPIIADAIMDRLVPGSHKLALKGDSMRKVMSS